jgi:hypothetical protein
MLRLLYSPEFVEEGFSEVRPGKRRSWSVSSQKKWRGGYCRR